MRDGMGFIVAAYTITWLGLIGYAIRLHRLSQRVRAEFTEAARDAASGGGDRD
jgi:CcmD family protein